MGMFTYLRSTSSRLHVFTSLRRNVLHIAELPELLALSYLQVIESLPS